ncbi:MAG: YdcF family protein [Nannocystaceae bacterium]
MSAGPERGSWLRRRVPEVGVALAIYTLINVAGEVTVGSFDTTAAWLSLPGGALRLVAALLFAALLLAHAWRPLQGLARVLGVAANVVVAGWALRDAAVYYALLDRSAIATTASAPLPASLLVCLVGLALAAEIAAPAPRRPRGRRRAATCLGTCVAVAVALPLVLMFTFGPTRYVRDADCIVVFGAKVYASGAPSQALADRVDEGIRLYRSGVAPTLVMSGAIDAAHGGSEPAAMRARAIAAGVPAAAIVVDEAGFNSAATVTNTAAWARERGVRRVVAVSHYYHQPRVKLLFERAGLRTYTVPATMRRRLLKEPYYLAREVLAYYAALLFDDAPELRAGEPQG